MVPINRRRASEEYSKVLDDSSTGAYKFTLIFAFLLSTHPPFKLPVFTLAHPCATLRLSNRLRLNHTTHSHKQMRPRQLSLICVVTPFLFVLYFALFAESDTPASLSTSSGIHPVSGLNYGGIPGRGGACADDNSGRGCCSNGQDFTSCFSACNGDDRCENWCRSNCWNYWLTGSGGPGYRYGDGNGNGNGNDGRWVGMPDMT